MKKKLQKKYLQNSSGSARGNDRFENQRAVTTPSEGARASLPFPSNTCLHLSPKGRVFKPFMVDDGSLKMSRITCGTPEYVFILPFVYLLFVKHLTIL